MSLTPFAAESVRGSAINLRTTVVTGVGKGVILGEGQLWHEQCCCPCAVREMKRKGHSAMHQTPLLRLPKGRSGTQHLGAASEGCRLWLKLWRHPKLSEGGKQDQTGRVFQNVSTHCTRCCNKEAPIYKPKLSEKRTQAAVLDFIDQLQRRYTNAQHQPQIIIAYSNTSGHSDVATFLLAKKWLILQAHWNAYILSFSASAHRAEYFDTKINLKVWGPFEPIYRWFSRGHLWWYQVSGIRYSYLNWGTVSHWLL